MEQHTKEPFEVICERLRESIRRCGLKNSRQREIILKILFEHGAHLNPEEILIFAKGVDKGASLSSIYRILSFLEREGFVKSLEVDKSGKRYEIARGGHHDHMICVGCGRVLEFWSEEIEVLQEKMAKSVGAKLIDHDMRLFILCKVCVGEKESANKK